MFDGFKNLGKNVLDKGQEALEKGKEALDKVDVKGAVETAKELGNDAVIKTKSAATEAQAAIAKAASKDTAIVVQFKTGDTVEFADFAALNEFLTKEGYGFVVNETK